MHLLRYGQHMTMPDSFLGKESFLILSMFLCYPKRTAVSTDFVLLVGTTKRLCAPVIFNPSTFFCI